MPIPCVDIVIKNEKGEFLLLRRKNKPVQGKWWFVGGRVKKGETLGKAVVRKVKEEIGLKISPGKMIGADATFFKQGFFGGSVHNISTVFLVKIKTKDKIRLDSQSEDYKWFKCINHSWSSYILKFLKIAGFKYCD